MKFQITLLFILLSLNVDGQVDLKIANGPRCFRYTYFIDGIKVEKQLFTKYINSNLNQEQLMLFNKGKKISDVGKVISTLSGIVFAYHLYDGFINENQQNSVSFFGSIIFSIGGIILDTHGRRMMNKTLHQEQSISLNVSSNTDFLHLGLNMKF